MHRALSRLRRAPKIGGLSRAKALLQSFSSSGALQESHSSGEGMYELAELRTMTLSPANERIGPKGNHCSYSRMIEHLTTVE